MKMKKIIFILALALLIVVFPSFVSADFRCEGDNDLACTYINVDYQEELGCERDGSADFSTAPIPCTNAQTELTCIEHLRNCNWVRYEEDICWDGIVMRGIMIKIIMRTVQIQIVI
jgi:hypothetical protein